MLMSSSLEFMLISQRNPKTSLTAYYPLSTSDSMCHGCETEQPVSQFPHPQNGDENTGVSSRRWSTGSTGAESSVRTNGPPDWCCTCCHGDHHKHTEKKLCPVRKQMRSGPWSRGPFRMGAWVGAKVRSAQEHELSKHGGEQAGRGP